MNRKRKLFFYGLAVCLIICHFAFYLAERGAVGVRPFHLHHRNRTQRPGSYRVWGGGVWNGGLSPILRDRVDTAVTLYLDGKVEKILVSGDNSTDSYDEPSAMMEYAIQRGVSPDDIQPDYGGRRTYDTCYRAREIFQLDSAILVTPAVPFTPRHVHLPAAGD